MRKLQARITRFVSRRVGAARPERLRRMMGGRRRRRIVLGVIFRAMPRVIRRHALARERLVVGWHITGRPDGRHDIRQLVIEDGSAAVLRGEQRDADLTIIADGATFLLLATGNGSPPAMFMRGEIEIVGDPWLAMRLPKIFAQSI